MNLQMNVIYAALVFVSSSQALAARKVGDTAVYEIETTLSDGSVFSNYEHQTEIISIDDVEGTATIRTSNKIKIGSGPSTGDETVVVDLVTTTLRDCGILDAGVTEKITTPAGTFAACKLGHNLPGQSGADWLSDLTPTGILQEEGDLQPSTFKGRFTMKLMSFTAGK